ncbi:response regulator [bacterium]|nr:response regulator [bacterium]
MTARLLIVDDELDIREMLSRHYRFKGFEVDLAGNGREALEILSKKRIEIVISDIMMPQMDGVELLKEIRIHYPMVRIIMITGYVTLDNALACMGNGAETLVFKPLMELKELDDAVLRALEGLKAWQKKLQDLQRMKPSADK